MLFRASFDDATIDDIKLADLLYDYGFQDNTTFFWPVMPKLCNEPKGRKSLTEQEMEDIAKSFTLGSHGLTHSLLTRVPIETARREIFESREILQQKFNQPIDSFAYPRGYANPDLMKLVEEAGYTSARSTVVGYIHESENPYFQQTTVHVGYDRKEYAGKSWYDYAIYMLEQAMATNNSVYNIWGHSYEIASYPNGMGLFEKLLAQIRNIYDQ